MTRKTLVLAGALLGALASPYLLSQQASDPTIGSESKAIDVGSFGSDSQDLWVDSVQFVPNDDISWVETSNAYRHNDSTTPAQLRAPVDLPAGAHVTAITCYFYDAGPGTASISLVRNAYDLLTNAPSSAQIGGFIESVGTFGYQRLTWPYDETVRYRGGNFVYFYSLAAIMPPGPTGRLRGCRILWNRQVTPAPTTATFADVPVGHPYHQFVEALADANITAGCAPNLFCVNVPITRGEMAVFLAVALGLHFPN